MNKIEKLIEELCPEGVEFNTLGDIGYLYGGLTGKSKEDFSNGDSKFVTYMNVFSNIAVNTDISDYVKIGKEEKQKRIECGDALFTGSSETPNQCGMSSILTKMTEDPLYLNSFCFGFRLYDKNIFLPGFLKYLFRGTQTRKQITKTANGVTRFNISKKRFVKITIPIPPLPIQEEIVKTLDNFTVLEAKLKAELKAELKARKKQYEYYREQLLNFDDGVRWDRLDQIINFMNGKGHEKNIDGNGKYIVANSKFVSTEGKVRKYSATQICPVAKNSILMVMSDLPNGKALAKCFYVDRDNKYTLNQRICSLTIRDSEELNAKYLFFVLSRNRQLLQYDNGVDQTNLRKGDILKINIPIPPLPEQKRIVSILEDFDSVVNDISVDLPAEIAARQKQYEYYRDQLLTFKPLEKQDVN
jgi:type I restriction enzyme, S subunit